MAPKKTDETAAPEAPTAIEVENQRLREQIAAQDARQDQIIDMMADMQRELADVKANGGGRPADDDAPTVSKEQREMDAELAALKEEFADYPAIDLIERRVLVGEDVSDEIRLKDEPSILVDPKGLHKKWKIRKFNFAVEGRAAKAQSEGYIKVRRDELQSIESLPTLTQQDEYARLGERGQEVLCKMPLKLYDYKKRRDQARRAGKLNSATAIRDVVANGVAAMAGQHGDNADQAGSFAHGLQVTVEPQASERVTF